jgi:AraC-like DNA-binding protein
MHARKSIDREDKTPVDFPSTPVRLGVAGIRESGIDILYRRHVLGIRTALRINSSQTGDAVRSSATAGWLFPSTAGCVSQKLKPLFPPPVCVDSGCVRNKFKLLNFAKSLAEYAGMSASSLHQHFRRVTAMTPLLFKSSCGCKMPGVSC